MTIKEFAHLSFFDLPIEGAEYFPENIEVIFAKYLERLQLIDDEHANFIAKHYSRIELTCIQIKKIINCVFEGRLFDAYQTLSAFISHFETYLSAEKNTIVRYHNTDSFFYRARLNAKREAFDAKGMFHIPFEKRYDIKTQRFSIPGLPCLYLADSVYTCWKELDCPKMGQVEYSRFRIVDKSVRFLDVSNHIGDVRDLLELNLPIEDKARQDEEVLKELERFIHLFPLYVACYSKVFKPDAIFKPEYIMPQLIMQYMASTNYYAGVKYQSTKAQITNANYPYSPVNYAFPVRSSMSMGYCNLMAQKFKMSEPIRLDKISHISAKELIDEVNRVNKGLMNNTLQRFNSPNYTYVTPLNKIFHDNEWRDYSQTDFAKVEHYLFLQEVEYLRPEFEPEY